MNLKKLCSLTLLIPTLASAQIDKKTILFLNMNNNPKEVEVAKKVAKAKGENFIVIPEAKTNDYVDFEVEVKKVLEKNKIQSLVLSGHNGGDSYSGSTGSISVPNLISAVEGSSSKESIKSLYLLGCNSANKSKIFFWKASLPELKFIAGYDGTAPLGHLPSGLNYFEDALRKEDAIIATSDAAKLKSIFESLRSVNSFQASVYSCDEKDVGHLFMSGRKGSERFGILDTKECSSKVNEFLTKYQPELKQYWSGEKEPTAINPSSGVLKDAYVFMRQNEHCITDGNEGGGILYDFNGDNLLFLRFNKDFNNNFINYYRETLVDAKKDFDEMIQDPDAYYKKLKEYKEGIAKKATELRSNPENLKALMASELQNVSARKEKIVNDNPGMRACLTTLGTQCQRFKSKLVNYYDLFALEYSLKEKEYIDQILNEFEISSVPSEADVKEMISSGKAKEMSDKIQAMLDNPDKVKRKDLLELSHNINSIQRLSTKQTSTLRILKGYEAMSGDNFPFSWHEVIKGEKIETPFVSKYSIDEIQGRKKKAKNPELEFLLDKIAGSY